MILTRQERVASTAAGGARGGMKKIPEVSVRDLPPGYFSTVTVTTFDQADSPAELKARTA
jgi:hypothetical protein